MKPSLISNAIIVAASLLGLGACAAKNSIAVVYESQNCRIKTSALRQLKSVDEISTLKPPAISLASDDQPAAPATIDVELEKNYLVLVALGEKSTAGYSLEQLAKETEIKNKVLHLPVSIQKPPSGIAAQVITSPCAVITLNKADYESVKWGKKSLKLK